MHKLTIFRRFIGVKHSLNTLLGLQLESTPRFKLWLATDSSAQDLTCDWGLEKSFSEEKKKTDFWSVSIKVKVFCITKLRDGRWQVKRVSVTNICFATDGKNKSWWACYLMTHGNNDWHGRMGEREDVYKRIKFNVSNECENFYWLIFLRFKSKVISTIKFGDVSTKKLGVFFIKFGDK